MTRHRAGLIVELVEQEGVGYHGAFYVDLMETLLKRLVLDAAFEQAKKTFLAPSIDAGRFTSVDWKLASKMEVAS